MKVDIGYILGSWLMLNGAFVLVAMGIMQTKKSRARRTRRREELKKRRMRRKKEQAAARIAFFYNYVPNGELHAESR